MIRFRYELTSFHRFLEELAVQLNTQVTVGKLKLTPEIGEGFMRVYDLPNGLQALAGEFSVRQDFLIERKKSRQEYYVFVCERIENARRVVVSIDKDTTEDKDPVFSAMYLLSFLSDLSQFVTSGSRLQTLRVILSRDWLARYLKIEELDEVLQRYLALKSRSINVKEVDFESEQLLHEIFQSREESPVENTIVQNRVMMLLENFFGWLYQQMSVSELNIRMTREEIDQILQIEQELLRDLAQPPTITQLARSAAISPSKLKRQFKDVFGLPIYVYFQKQRMAKAREMLLEGGRTIREIGMEMGFSNLSNFTLAFKKAHQLLPSELLKINTIG